jgi:hypothetical protein
MVDLWSKEHLRLADHVTLSRAGRDLLFSADVVLKFPDCSQSCLALAGRLRGGVLRSEIDAALIDADSRSVLETLMKLGYLVPVRLNPWANEIYAKHFAYFEGIGLDPVEAQQRLLKSHLVLIGLGGTGSIVLQHLVGAGIGRYTLIDGDTVDTTNLNRQFVYGRDDVGRPKVEAAARYIRERLPSAQVETRKGWVRSAGDIEAMLPAVPSTMLINAADHPKGGGRGGVLRSHTSPVFGGRLRLPDRLLRTTSPARRNSRLHRVEKARCRRGGCSGRG